MTYLGGTTVQNVIQDDIYVTDKLTIQGEVSVGGTTKLIRSYYRANNLSVTSIDTPTATVGTINITSGLNLNSG